MIEVSTVVGPIVGSNIAQEMPLWAWLVAHLMFGVIFGAWPVLRPASDRTRVYTSTS